MKARKAQSAFEFLLLVGVAFVMAIVFLIGSLSDIKDLSEKKEYFLVREQADRIWQEISLAVQVEDGYRRSFTIPEQLENREYGILMSNNTLILTSEHVTYILRIPGVGGNITKGVNNITREEGMVRIN